MTMDEYRSLSKEDRYILWLSRSMQVASYDDAEIVSVLYQLDNFYVEIRFFKNSLKQCYFRTFTNTYFLAPYLAQIDIRKLFE